MSTEGGDLILKIIVAVGLVILLFAIPECGPNTQLQQGMETTETGVTYKYFTIKGMPCVYVQVGEGRSATGGPSCDWTKWRGE